MKQNKNQSKFLKHVQMNINSAKNLATVCEFLVPRFKEVGVKEGGFLPSFVFRSLTASPRQLHFPQDFLHFDCMNVPCQPFHVHVVLSAARISPQVLTKSSQMVLPLGNLKGAYMS